MNRNRNWLGWVGVGLGAIAVLIAVSGWASPLFAGAGTRFGASQTAAQPGNQAQNALPGNQAQSALPSNQAQNVPQRNQAQSALPGNQQQLPQRGQFAPNADSGRQGGKIQRGGQPDGHANGGSWFGLPFRLFNALGRVALVALVALLGLTLLRNRGWIGKRPAESAPQAQQSTTGETYIDESGNPA